MNDFLAESSELAQGKERLRAQYRSKLPDRLADINDDWAKISVDGWNEEVARSIHNACHLLAGTGKTFGYSNVTKYARIVETKLTEEFDCDGGPSREHLDELGVAVNNLLVNGPIMDSGSDSNSPDAAADQAADTTATGRQRVGSKSEEQVRRVQPLSTLPIYIVEDDKTLADHIVMELALRGYDGRAVYDLADLEPQIRRSGVSPGAIVMDVAFPDAINGGIDVINKFRQDEVLKSLVVFISANGSFSTRLKIVRAGADAFFAKPIDVSGLIENWSLWLARRIPIRCAYWW